MKDSNAGGDFPLPRTEDIREGVTRVCGQPPAARQLDQLVRYIELLCRWNRVYNLTAVRKPADMIPRHLLDSLSILPWAGQGELLDAGSGAGLPGVPLAIMRPDLEVTLLDSVGKKVRFLRKVRRELQLNNIQPVRQRLETLSHAGGFDTVVSRALSSLAEFAALARHLLRPDSRLLAMKGHLPADEMAALPGWLQVQAVEPLSVPGLQQHRHLVIMSTHSLTGKVE